VREKEFVDSLALSMIAAGYDVKRDWRIPNSKLNTSIYAKRNRFYFFVYDIECDLQGYLNDIVSVHRAAQRYINELYTFPKAFRLAIPTIVTVVVSTCGYDEQELDWIRTESVSNFFDSVVGGEANAIFLVDAARNQVLDLKWLDFNAAIPITRARNMLENLINQIRARFRQ
jgi:hypothetical protein